MDRLEDAVDAVAARLSKFGESLAKELEDILEALVAVVLGLFEIVPEIIKNGWALLFLLGTGITLVYARARVIASADGLALVLPAVLQGVNVLITTLDGLIGVVGTISATVSNLVQSKSVADENIGTYFRTIPTINVESVAAWIREVPAQCAPYTSSTTVIDGLIRQAASPSVCPAMRRLYVVDWLYPWVYPIVDFFALTYDPTPPYIGSENNCRPTERVPRWECLVLGSGYVVLELVLPLLLFSIVYAALGKPLLGLAYAIVVLAAQTVSLSVLSGTGALAGLLGVE